MDFTSLELDFSVVIFIVIILIIYFYTRTNRYLVSLISRLLSLNGPKKEKNKMPLGEEPKTLQSQAATLYSLGSNQEAKIRVEEPGWLEKIYNQLEKEDSILTLINKNLEMTAFLTQINILVFTSLTLELVFITVAIF
jgi:hypothetical protein